MDNYYHITVGKDRIKTVQIGKIEPGSGLTVLSEDRGETLARRGDVMFPNKCQVWAARVIDGKMPAKDEPMISVTNPKYVGELKGLKWGAPGGTIIEARYIRGYQTLDVLYQEKVLNFKINDDDESSADANFIRLLTGDSDFEESIDPYFVQHLKWHSYNSNSISRNPQFYTSWFSEKSFEQEERLDTQTWDEDFEARKIVSETGSGADAMQKCKNLVTIVKPATDEMPEDQKMYAYLKMLSAKKPSQFLNSVREYKVKISNVFEMIKSYEIADLTVDGTLVVEEKAKGGIKKVILLTDLPTKGEGIYDYMLENFTEPKIYEAIFKLIQITDKIK